MRSKVRLSKVALVSLIVFLITSGGCGGGGSRLSPTTFSPNQATQQREKTFVPQPAKVVALADLFAELDALQPPPGVSETFFNDLKAELRAQLTNRLATRVVSVPPSGPENEVTDLVVTDNGDETYTLEWSYFNVGDYDQNGTVAIADITPLAQHFFHQATDGVWPDTDDEYIDGDGNGVINIGDITPLAQHFFNEVAAYSIEAAVEFDGTYEEIATVDFSEAVEGSRKRFKLTSGFIYSSQTSERFNYFRVTPLDRAGARGAIGRRIGLGPTAQADADQVDGLTFKFYGVGSTPRGGNVYFAWDFNSDGVFETLPARAGIDPNSSPGEQSPTYTYPAEGTYTATLRVYDALGGFSEAKVTVNAYTSTPASSPPAATALVLDLTGQSPFMVRFIGIGDDADGQTGPFTYEWNFGDGTPTSSEQFPEHTYSRPGLYRVKLTVTDDEGDTSVARLTLAVCCPLPGNIPDVFGFALPFVYGDFKNLSLDARFGGQGADMDGGPVNFTWYFGFGSVGELLRDPTITFPQEGNYFVTLTTEDDEGNESGAGFTIFAGTPAPSTPYPPAIWLAGYMTTGSQNYRQQFFTEAFDPDGGDVTLSYDFDGDGVFGDFGETGSDPIVTYTVPGNYEVWVEATDDEGEVSYAYFTFVVKTYGIPEIIPPPPPNHIVDGGGGGGDGRIGINPKCYPRPAIGFHGDGGATLYLIYNGPVDPGDPQVKSVWIQSFGGVINPMPVTIDNVGNGAGGGPIVAPDPAAPAPPSPPLNPGQSWTAFKVTRPLDGPNRIEKISVKFKMRDDGLAAATKTCDAYIVHLQHQIIVPAPDSTVEGDVPIRVRIAPAGIDQVFGFPGFDPGNLLRVYLTIDGVIVGEMTRDDQTDEWVANWDSTSVGNGAHTIDFHVYDARGPQPGDPNDPGPIQEGQINVNVDNVALPGVAEIDLELLQVPPFVVGVPFDFKATTRDNLGAPVFNPFFDVFINVFPEQSETRSQLPTDTGKGIFQMTSNGDGTYSLPFFSQVAGTWNATVIVRDNRTGDKVGGLGATVQFETIPTEMVSMSLHGLSSHFGPVKFFGGDNFGNTVPAVRSDFNVFSDNPAIIPGAVDVSPISPNLFFVPFTATDYAVGMLSVEHTASGVTESQFVGYPPWKMHLNGYASGGPGLQENQDFFLYVDARIPDGATTGWHSGFTTIVWQETNPPISFVDAFPGMADVTLNFQPPEYDPISGFWYLTIDWMYEGAGTVFGESTPLSIQFAAPDLPEDSLPVDGVFGIAQYVLWDDRGRQIPYNPDIFFTPVNFWDLTFSIKPTKTLNMHVYIVEGSATQADAEADIQAAEDMFNANAASCTLGFYVDFVPTFTTIPQSDWDNIDEDGDGLDRYDANGDGDYADPGDNNDLFNAMNAGYYDVSANTENIYYVPGIRGGAVGSTYWPNQQVAVDNGADPDNLTLAHEKVHEMDLRGDGDFDVLDGADMDDATPGVQADPDARTQGAYQPGNIMNYGDTGTSLTGDQAQHLDP